MKFKITIEFFYIQIKFLFFNQKIINFLYNLNIYFLIIFKFICINVVFKDNRQIIKAFNKYIFQLTIIKKHQNLLKMLIIL